MCFVVSFSFRVFSAPAHRHGAAIFPFPSDFEFICSRDCLLPTCSINHLFSNGSVSVCGGYSAFFGSTNLHLKGLSALNIIKIRFLLAGKGPLRRGQSMSCHLKVFENPGSWSFIVLLTSPPSSVLFTVICQAARFLALSPPAQDRLDFFPAKELCTVPPPRCLASAR